MTTMIHPEADRRILEAEQYGMAFWKYFHGLCDKCTHNAITGTLYGWHLVFTPPCPECWVILQKLPDDTGRLMWRTDEEMLGRYRLLDVA